MNEIAVFSPIHRRPDLVLDQLKNYSLSHQSDAFHILHPSIEGRPNFEKLSETLEGINCKVLINPVSLSTSWRSIFAAYVSNTNFLLENSDFKPSYIYLHTDSDLIVKGSLSDYVLSNEFAFTADKIHPTWHWYKQMQEDARFSQLRDYLSIKDDEVFGGRHEGSFYPTQVWMEVLGVITKFYNSEFFNTPSIHWPIEEVLLQTIIKKIYPSAVPNPIVVKTSPMKNLNAVNPRDVDENCVRLEEVEKILASHSYSNSCIGMKWFSQNYDDEARMYVRSLVFA